VPRCTVAKSRGEAGGLLIIAWIYNGAGVVGLILLLIVFDRFAVVGIEERTRTHDLRHVAASALIAHGMSVSAVQAVLG
jgi:integrase